MRRWREKIIPPPNVIISTAYGQRNTNAVRGLEKITASNRQKKLKRLSPRSLPVSGQHSTHRPSPQTTVWHSRQRHWKTRANGRRRQHFSQRLALDPAAYGLLTTFAGFLAGRTAGGHAT
ncbi:hypothetical protein ACLK1T_13770 [Escherichia coli]